MIESLQPASLSLPKRAAPDGADAAPGFSYALASASLETRAGEALKAFGATGGGEFTESRDARPRAQGAEPAAPTRADAPPRADRAAPANAAAPAAKSSVAQTAPAPASAAASPAAAAAATPVAIVSPAAAQQPAPAAVAPRVEAGARETLAARGAQEAAKPKAPAAPRAEPPASLHDFARLIARKLEGGASSFDLRLDPPELGRIAARLTVGDDGKAQLALSFDSQTALDLFRRDEAGLRDMLTASGFDLGAGDLAFSFDPSGEAPGATAEFTPAAPPQTASSSEPPMFLASFSRGVVDLFI